MKISRQAFHVPLVLFAVNFFLPAAPAQDRPPIAGSGAWLTAQ